MANQRTIDESPGNLPSAQKETIQYLRILIKNNAPETVEFVKNEKITYKQGDKDFVWISHYQDHVDLEFAMGASLYSNLLKTRGVAEKNGNTRHISIGNIDRAKPELTKLLKQATSVGLEHCPT